VRPAGLAQPRNTPIWRFSIRPAVPEYWRCTPADLVPSSHTRCHRRPAPHRGRPRHTPGGRKGTGAHGPGSRRGDTGPVFYTPKGSHGRPDRFEQTKGVARGDRSAVAGDGPGAPPIGRTPRAGTGPRKSLRDQAVGFSDRGDPLTTDSAGAVRGRVAGLGGAAPGLHRPGVTVWRCSCGPSPYPGVEPLVSGRVGGHCLAQVLGPGKAPPDPHEAGPVTPPARTPRSNGGSWRARCCADRVISCCSRPPGGEVDGRTGARVHRFAHTMCTRAFVHAVIVLRTACHGR
jgi:hypothetical protein